MLGVQRVAGVRRPPLRTLAAPPGLRCLEASAGRTGADKYRSLMTYEQGPSSGPGPKRISPRMAVAIVLAVLLLVFIAQNTGDTTVHLLWMHFSTGVWFVVLLAGLIGAGVMFLVLSRRYRREA